MTDQANDPVTCGSHWQKESMKIKMKSTMAGPSGNHHPGDEIEVDAVHGRDLVVGGHAVEIVAKRLEQAVLAGAPETAVMPQVVGQGAARKGRK